MQRRLHPPTAEHLSILLAEVRAQHDIHPSEYLDGVLYALLLAVTPGGYTPSGHSGRPGGQPHNQHVGRHRRTDETAGARRSSGHRDGVAAAVAWIVGATPIPPVHVIMTLPSAGSDGRR